MPGAADDRRFTERSVVAASGITRLNIFNSTHVTGRQRLLSVGLHGRDDIATAAIPRGDDGLASGTDWE
tara:strand:- start:628 stop:834 length:207 start_codon:yes stop_codon:yes gene_type:complete